MTVSPAAAVRAASANGHVASVAATPSRFSTCMQLASTSANRSACWLLVQQIARRSWLLVHGVNFGRPFITRPGRSSITCTCSSLFRCECFCYWPASPASLESDGLLLLPHRSLLSCFSTLVGVCCPAFPALSECADLLLLPCRCACGCACCPSLLTHTHAAWLLSHLQL